MKQIYEGYLLKSQINEKWFNWVDDRGQLQLDFNKFIYCYKTKGKKDQYEQEDYPPKKVKITIEIED